MVQYTYHLCLLLDLLYGCGTIRPMSYLQVKAVPVEGTILNMLCLNYHRTSLSFIQESVDTRHWILRLLCSASPHAIRLIPLEFSTYCSVSNTVVKSVRKVELSWETYLRISACVLICLCESRNAMMSRIYIHYQKSISQHWVTGTQMPYALKKGIAFFVSTRKVICSSFSISALHYLLTRS